ncbi:MAG: PEGA domain-containing protein [Methanomicrobiaceae archaeon]|uniref:PEGA domain-containing protein n=1 Tax=Methanoculleus sp. TaxID=90427 RepID=UPI00320EDD93|nr:PEGA domain-containing protein [Methanomicrobiaceae archaeon]
MVSAHTQGSSRRLIILSLCLLLALAAQVTAAPTTELRVAKIAADGVTVIDEKTVDYRWLERNLPVQGDGVTHYYHQGPVFEGDPWNPEEDTNVKEKDMGAVKGTDLKDICELVGGMSEGETVRVKAVDGMSRPFPYRNVYEPEPRQGPMVITWYRAEDGYVPDYTTGMRLVFFADTSTNPDGIHAFGVSDMRECFDPDDWYFFQPGLPTTTGLSVQWISQVIIYSDEEAVGSIHVNSTPSGAVIFIDDEETGDVTPCTLSGIEVGSHQVQVKKEGFVHSDEKWVTVVANAVTEVEFYLTPETESGGDGSSDGGTSTNGSIAITSVPMNASIYLDGNMTGFRTDATLEDIPPGEHTIELVLPGYPNMTRTVTVEVGECSLLDLIFENSTTGKAAVGTGRITVSSVPANASIYLDGSAAGSRTNATLEAVPAGEHTVELVMPGYRNATRTVTVEEGGHTTLDLLLSPAGGEAGANTTGRGEPTSGHPAPNNPIEAFVEAVLAFVSRLFSFFGMGEATITPPGPESAPVPGEGATTPVPTGTPVLPVQAPGETRSMENHSGGLYIDSYPPGMAIVIDNKKLVWKTPQVVYGLRGGLHTISVEESDPDRNREDSGYRFEALQAWVYPDAVAPVLLDGLTNQIKKTVRIGSETYQGEKFTVNGFFPAGTIPGDAGVEGAKSWITVFWNGTYRSHAIPSGIATGETYTVEPQSEDVVPISIRSSPEGAAVFIDGFPTGKVTPCRVDGLSPGQHRILVSMPGYLPAEEVIRIPEKAKTGGSISCTLRGYTHGDLLVESTIPEAKIYLYGRYTGEKTPHTFPGMSIGTYEVRVVSEDDSRTIEDVLVTPGETTRRMVTLKEEHR